MLIFRLNELFQVKNGLTTSLIFLFFLKMPKIWVGQTTLKGDKKEDGLSIKHLRVMLLPPARDASPLQGYPPSSMSPIPIYTPGWREAKWSKVPCLREICDREGVNPRPQDPEFDVLTTQPHTPPHVIWVYKLIRIKALIKHFFATLKCLCTV